MQQRSCDDTLGSPPHAGKLKHSKAPGTSSILPEMVKVGKTNSEFVDKLTDVMRSVWEKAVPKEWRDAIICVKEVKPPEL